MDIFDLPERIYLKKENTIRKGISNAIDKAYALARENNRPFRWFRSTDLSHGWIRGFHHKGEIFLNIDGQRPHCDTTSVCLPRYLALVYPCLVRP